MDKYSIEVTKTSNPNIVKFVANTFVAPSGSHEFNNIDEAKTSPLAQELFYLPFVKTVFISQNFVAIEKFDIVEWEDVEEEVAEAISEYLNAGKAVINEEIGKKFPATVYAESTPNPSVMKFVANKKLVETAYEYKDSYETIQSPLATALFAFPFVKEVFINNNFVSITKHAAVEWDEVIMEIREFLRQYVMDGKTIVNEAINNNGTGDSFSALEKTDKEYSEIEKEIMSILKEYIEPAVTEDGGQIIFHSYNTKNKAVKVVLKGACSGCPSSTVTLKNGIENVLNQMLPNKIGSVEAING